MKRTSRKAKRTSRNPRRGSKVEFVVDLSHAPHIEDVKFTDASGAKAILFRGLRPLVEFKPTDSQVKKILSGKGKLQITEGQIVARSRWPHVGKLESNGYGRSRYGSYSNDPRWMAAKYPGVDSEGKSFRKGDEILYWPSTKTVMTGATAKDAWRRFLSEKGDDEGSPFASNPRRKRTSRNPKLYEVWQKSMSARRRGVMSDTLVDHSLTEEQAQALVVKAPKGMYRWYRIDHTHDYPDDPSANPRRKRTSRNPEHGATFPALSQASTRRTGGS